MAHELTTTERALIRELLTQRCADRGDLLEAVDGDQLTTDQRREIVAILGDEITRTGFDEHYEPTQRGRQLEALLDAVNRPNVRPR